VAMCFEVSVNAGIPVLAGSADATVLTAIVTFVREHAELELKVGGLLDDRDHVDWVDRPLKQGDVVTVRIVDSDQPSQPIARHRADPAVDAAREREYYEHLRRKYEANEK
jgi:hypothetical protein